MSSCNTITVGGGSWQQEVSWVISDENGNQLLSGGAPFDGNIGDCEGISDIPGCTDESAINYNPDANTDDGSCITAIACEEGLEGLVISMEDSYGDGWNGNLYSLVNASGEVVATGGLSNVNCPDFNADLNPFAQCEESESGSDELCVPAGCYVISVNGGDYITETSWSVWAQYNGESIANGGGDNAATTFGLSTDEDCSSIIRL